MSFGEYGLEGAMEQARVTGLGVQEKARKSPGAGITAMQMLTALRNGVMVPLQKQQAEDT
jgi:DNA polymerase-2